MKLSTVLRKKEKEGKSYRDFDATKRGRFRTASTIPAASSGTAIAREFPRCTMRENFGAFNGTCQEYASPVDRVRATETANFVSFDLHETRASRYPCLFDISASCLSLSLSLHFSRYISEFHSSTGSLREVDYSYYSIRCWTRKHRFSLAINSAAKRICPVDSFLNRSRRNSSDTQLGKFEITRRIRGKKGLVESVKI